MTLEEFFSHEIKFEDAMKPFTWQHGILILIAILTVVLTLKYANKIKGLQYEKKIKIAFAVWILSFELLYHIHYWMHGLFSIPMHMCSIGAFLSVYVLLTDSKKAFQVLYLIGITGGFTALVMPDTLGYPYYNLRYYLFPLMHVNILIVPIYYYKAYGYRLKYYSVYIAFGIIVGLMPIAYQLNQIYERNYLFTGTEPRILAAYLPGWPYYIFVGITGMFIAFHVVYYLQFLTSAQLKQYVGLSNKKEN